MTFGNSLERSLIDVERKKLRERFAVEEDWKSTIAVRWKALMFSKAAAHEATAERYQGRFPKEYQETKMKEAQCRAMAVELPEDQLDAQVQCHLAGFQ